MTTPNTDAVRDGLQRHLRPRLTKTTASRNLKADLALVSDEGVQRSGLGELASVALGMAMGGALAEVVAQQVGAGLSEDVKAKRDEYREMFDNFGPLIQMKIAQGTQIANSIRSLAAFEFVTDTGRGSAALGKVKSIDSEIKDLFHQFERLVELKPGLAQIRGAEDLKKYEEFEQKLIKKLEHFAGLMTDAAAAAQNMIEEEAIKAWVKKNPDEAHKKLKAALYTADQVLNGLEFVGDKLSDVPDPHVQAASTAIDYTAATAKAVKALVQKALLSADAERQMANYENENLGGAIWDEHNKNPLMMAEMLAEKKKADIDLILALVRPVIKPLVNRVPAVGAAWDAIELGITTAVEAYFDRRMELAQGIEQQQKKDPGLVEQYLEELGQQFKDNIFMVFDPFSAAKDAAVQLVAKRVAAMIMEELPIKPAQKVDGSSLKAKVEELSNAFFTQFHQKGEAQKPKYDFARPTEDRDGNAIQQILSEIREDDAGPYQLVKIGGKVGKLRRGTEEFLADDADLDPVDKILLQFVPSTDAKSRAIDEIDLADGLKKGVESRGIRGREPVTLGAAYWARIGEVWGYLDQASPNTFWPRRPDGKAFADWSGRVVKKHHYTDGGQETKGEWYKPWDDQEYYLFVKADGSREWARGADTTGNGGGTRYNITHLLGDKHLAGYPNL